MLRRAFDNGAGVQRPPIIMIEGEEEFEVQAIPKLWDFMPLTLV